MLSDHVLRETRSFANRHNKPRRSQDAHADLHVKQSTGPVLAEIATNNQTLRPGPQSRASPASSIERKRAEQILKQHGSPPGLRVTAGGRIVTSDQSPLCSPRYGYSAINKNGGLIRFAPGYPPPPHTFSNFAKSLPNGFVAQNPDGKLCQMVDGRFLPISEVNGLPQLFITAPNLASIPPLSGHSPERSRQDGDAPAKQQESMMPPASVQVSALEKEYQKLETERRGLDKTEVLQRAALTSKSYNQLIQKRREIVSSQDELRRNIKTLKDARASAESSAIQAESQAFPTYDEPRLSVSSMFPAMPFSGWSFDGNGFDGQGMMPYMMPAPATNNFAMYPPYQAFPMPPVNMPASPYMTATAQNAGDFQASAPDTNHVRHDDPALAFPSVPHELVVGSSRYQSHDKLTDRRDSDRTHLQPVVQTGHGDVRKSVLNPKSAIYRPPAMSEQPDLTPHAEARTDTRAASPGAIATPSIGDDATHSEVDSRRHSSECSFATADFFPQRGVSKGVAAGHAADGTTISQVAPEASDSEQVMTAAASIVDANTHGFEHATHSQVREPLGSNGPAEGSADGQNNLISELEATENAQSSPDPQSTESVVSYNRTYIDQNDKLTNIPADVALAMPPLTTPQNLHMGSLQSFSLQRAYPGHRVLSSPALDWKSSSSIAQVAGLATGYMAQFDGTIPELAAMDVLGPLARRSTSGPSVASSMIARPSTPTMPEARTSRFTEEAMPETDSPRSPAMSPSGRRTSPAKARFAQIAGMAGIKVRVESNENKDGHHEPLTPQERRRWRNVWKKKHTE